MTHPRPREVVLLVQKEVADRLTAKVGTSEYGAMSVGLRAVAQVEKVLNVPRTAFKPVPRVDSTLVKILPHYPPLISPQVEKYLRIITRSFFQWRRKQIQKIMRDHPDLNFAKNALEEIALDTGWDLSRRPETLAPTDFINWPVWLGSPWANDGDLQSDATCSNIVKYFTIKIRISRTGSKCPIRRK